MMSTRPSRTGTTAWRRITAQVRALGREHDLPCSICHGARGPIDYRTQGEADADARATGQWWMVGTYRPDALDVDHVIPHAVGGLDTIENAAPSHQACNRQAQTKGAKFARKPTKPKPSRVLGTWQPLSGDGPGLPAFDVPGKRTTTHTFVADP